MNDIGTNELPPTDQPREATQAGPPGRPTTSRRALLAAGTGAALAAGAAAVVPTTAAADDSYAGRHRGFETRIKVAPGVSVNVADFNGGRKGTVLLIPGWPLASKTLEYTSLFLADHGYRAIALDQRGFGESDAPYGPYGYNVWAADIQTVLKALSLRDVNLVAHSMGAAVAIRHVARYGNRIRKLVVAEAPVPRFVYGPHSADLAAGLAGLISGYASNRAATIRDLTKNFFSTHTDIDNDPYLQWFERQCLDEASLPASRAGLIALRDTDLTSDLAKVSVPTLVIHAVNDKILPLDHGQAVANGIRNARLLTFATAGHAVYVDERDRFNAEILRFIS